MFVRGQVPMTKEEVRVISLAKARLKDSHVVWDIGAGTGSISVETALAVSNGKVCAVERDQDAVELIRSNISSFGLQNVVIYQGLAPEILELLPQPDRVFIGGSGGNFKEIMKLVYDKLQSGGRVVINAVVLETLIEAVEMMKSLNFIGLDITQVNISKTTDLGRIHMFKSHNPVFVISGEKP